MTITVTRHIQAGEKSVSTTATCDVPINNESGGWIDSRCNEITSLVRAVKDGVSPEHDDQ